MAENEKRPDDSLAGLTGLYNEIEFKNQLKQILKNGGVTGLIRAMQVLNACFMCALDVYQDYMKERYKVDK